MTKGKSCKNCRHWVVCRLYQWSQEHDDGWFVYPGDIAVVCQHYEPRELTP